MASSSVEERSLCMNTFISASVDLETNRFQFLAYSSSALREHSVWFVSPFQDPGNTWHTATSWVTADAIRKTLGDFSGVANQPAKYAARMAQAFTATDPSVKISRDQWHEVPDLGEKPYLHTDGKPSFRHASVLI
jgi:RNA-dependent RNA polymerase